MAITSSKDMTPEQRAERRAGECTVGTEHVWVPMHPGRDETEYMVEGQQCKCGAARYRNPDMHGWAYYPREVEA